VRTLVVELYQHVSGVPVCPFRYFPRSHAYPCIAELESTDTVDPVSKAAMPTSITSSLMQPDVMPSTSLASMQQSPAMSAWGGMPQHGSTHIPGEMDPFLIPRLVVLRILPLINNTVFVPISNASQQLTLALLARVHIHTHTHTHTH
jgi:hypothetical protein